MRSEAKNLFGAVASAQGIDLQRSDLFKVSIELPSVLGVRWNDSVQFLVENFPFPKRSIDTIEVKYLQQTNWLIGKDAAIAAVELKVRYAFAHRVAEALEKWFYLVSNPQTGGVGLTSLCKTNGWMRWLVPNMQRQVQDIRGNAREGENTLAEGLTYILEGCLIKG